MGQAIAKADPQSSAILLRLVRPDESDLAYQLHLAVRRTLAHRSFMYEHGLDFFHNVALARGRLIGAYDDGRLVGYSALRLEGNEQASHGRNLRHLSLSANQIAEGAGGAILPEYRRRGLFARLLRERNDVARELGLKFQTSIVAPGNIVSLRAFLAEGFVIAARYEDEDGDNYLMLKPLLAAFRFDARPAYPAALNDVAGNLRLLRTGLCGVPRGQGEELHLLYRRIAIRTLEWSGDRPGDAVAQ